MISRAMISKCRSRCSLLRIDRVRGIVIIDPFIHRGGVRQNEGVPGQEPGTLCDALRAPATRVRAASVPLPNRKVLS